MSDAKVKFEDVEFEDAAPGREAYFSFQCPLHAGRRCSYLAIHGRTGLKHDPSGQNDGTPHWTWNGDRERPTFSPSVDHKGCWHGYIENGRCVSVNKVDEPEPRT